VTSRHRRDKKVNLKNPMVENYHKITLQRTGKVIADKARIAQDYKSRSIGLLCRKSLKDGEALLIKPCNSIHTLFMHFPIDVAFLNKRGKVVGIIKGMGPWRLASCIFKGYMTLEMPIGTIEKYSIKIEDFITIE
jgi:uncharacterized membrane protein (UPF0127 family)